MSATMTHANLKRSDKWIHTHDSRSSFLPERCNAAYSTIVMSSSVCETSVLWQNIHQKARRLAHHGGWHRLHTSRGFHWKVTQWLFILLDKFDDEIHRDPRESASNQGWMVFDFADLYYFIMSLVHSVQQVQNKNVQLYNKYIYKTRDIYCYKNDIKRRVEVQVAINH